MTTAAFQLETLLDQAALEAQLAHGLTPAYLEARGADRGRAEKTARTVRVKQKVAPRWTEEELDFVRDNLGELTYQEVADALGRTPTAIKIKQFRAEIPAPSRRPGYITRNEVSKALGVDNHAPAMWEKRGVIEFGNAGTAAGYTTGISYLALLRWVYNVDNWPYFRFDLNKNPREIADPFIAELIARREARWDDEWWTTGDVAAHFGVKGYGVINKRIREGRLPGVRWGNWWVKRSDALKLDIQPRKGRR